MKYYMNSYWYCGSPANTCLDNSAGKFIAYIRCINFTTEQIRFVFFEQLLELINTHSHFPVCGKIGRTINVHNLCPILLYCNEEQKDQLKEVIKKIKPLLDKKYESWFNLCSSSGIEITKNKHTLGEHKILTWHWYWKSNRKTLEEIQNKTHWTFKQKIRK